MQTLLLQKPAVSLMTYPTSIPARTKKQTTSFPPASHGELPRKDTTTPVGNNPTCLFPQPSHMAPRFHFTSSISNGSTRWNPLSKHVSSSVDITIDIPDHKIPLPYFVNESPGPAPRAAVQLYQQTRHSMILPADIASDTSLEAPPFLRQEDEAKRHTGVRLQSGLQVVTQVEAVDARSSSTVASGSSGTDIASKNSSSRNSKKRSTSTKDRKSRPQDATSLDASSSGGNSSNLHHICSTKQRAAARDRKQASMTVIGGSSSSTSQVPSSASVLGVHQARASRLLGSSREAQLEGVRLAGSSFDEELDEQRAAMFSREASTVGQFFQNTGATLLTAEDEVELAYMSRDCVHLKELRAELTQKLGHHVTATHMAKALDMDVEAYNRRESLGCSAQKMLMDRNRLLVISVAKKYSGRGVAFSDLVAIGMGGLLKGIERFKPEKGFRLSTYVTWWIRSLLGRATQEQSAIIRIPSPVQEEKSRLVRAQDAISRTQVRVPTCTQLSQASGLSERKVAAVLALQKRGEVKSLDAPVAGQDQNMTGSYGDTIEQEVLSDHGGDFAELGLTNSGKDILQQQLEAIFATLSPRERCIADMRFGLDSSKSKTCQEASVILGVSRTRVNQIERRIIEKLRKDPVTFAMLTEMWGLVVENDKTFASIRSSTALIKSK